MAILGVCKRCDYELRLVGQHHLALFFGRSGECKYESRLDFEHNLLHGKAGLQPEPCQLTSKYITGRKQS